MCFLLALFAPLSTKEEILVQKDVLHYHHFFFLCTFLCTQSGPNYRGHATINLNGCNYVNTMRGSSIVHFMIFHNP